MKTDLGEYSRVVRGPCMHMIWKQVLRHDVASSPGPLNGSSTAQRIGRHFLLEESGDQTRHDVG